MFGRDTILADLELIKPIADYKVTDELELQVQLCKILGVAFALSLVRLSGLGSLIALVLGLRVLRVIKHRQGRVGSLLLAWWCIIAGAFGLLITPFFYQASPLIVMIRDVGIDRFWKIFHG